MKRLIIGILIALLVLGCTRPEQPPEPKIEELPVVEDKVIEEVIPPKEEPPVVKEGSEPEEDTRTPGPEPEKEKELEKKELDEKIKDLLKRADEKVQSYSFYPTVPSEYRQRDQWIIRGNKVRINLFNEKNYHRDIYFDTVFLDTEKKTAEGWCLGSSTRCGVSAWSHPFELEYVDYFGRTPYEWTKAIDNGEIFQTETIDNKISKVIRFILDDESCDIWVAEFSGLTLQVKCEGEKPTVIFKDVIINSYSELDVSPPKRG